jgi:transcriptional regulator with XRE-family HTH domain
MLGDRIKELRISRKITQKHFGEILNVSQQAIWKWETKKNLPNIETIIRIANYFNVSCDYLLERTDCEKGYIIEKMQLPIELKNKTISLEVFEDIANCGLSEKQIKHALKLYKFTWKTATRIVDTLIFAFIRRMDWNVESCFYFVPCQRLFLLMPGRLFYERERLQHVDGQGGLGLQCGNIHQRQQLSLLRRHVLGRQLVENDRARVQIALFALAHVHFGHRCAHPPFDDLLRNIDEYIFIVFFRLFPVHSFAPIFFIS